MEEQIYNVSYALRIQEGFSCVRIKKALAKTVINLLAAQK
jgi:hypothetical protein